MRRFWQWYLRHKVVGITGTTILGLFVLITVIGAVSPAPAESITAASSEATTTTTTVARVKTTEPHASTTVTTGTVASTTTSSSTTVPPTTTSPSTTVPPTTTSPSTTVPPTTTTTVLNSAGAVLPDPRRTPGATNPQVTQADIHSTICVSGWTSTIRPDSSYTTSLKEQQLAAGYAYHGDKATSDYEEDHLIPLEIGGSPTSPLNLWPEPYNAPDGARIKDQIENKLNALVCDGAISLASAQHAIAANWYQAYVTYVGAPSAAAPTPTTAATVPVTLRKSLSCTASMSNSAPTDYSTTDVIVHTAAGASATTTAHYKSTSTTHTGTATSSGVATIAYDISRATVGYPVTVDVTVSAGRATASCSTSFTPR